MTFDIKEGCSENEFSPKMIGTLLGSIRERVNQEVVLFFFPSNSILLRNAHP